MAAICDTVSNLKDYILNLSPADQISFLSFIVVVISGIFALFQWRESTTIKRAEYLNELVEKIRTDKDISKAIYYFDYNMLWYNKDFHGSYLERKIDRALSFFSYIIYLKNNKIIQNKEFRFFKYNIERMITNKQTIDYFYNLYHFAQIQGICFSFTPLLEYARHRNLIDEDFWDSKSYMKELSKSQPKYHRYLNF